MEYLVQVVEDDQLPSDSPWSMVKTSDHMYLFVARSSFFNATALCAVLSSAWFASRHFWPVVEAVLAA